VREKISEMSESSEVKSSKSYNFNGLIVEVVENKSEKVSQSCKKREQVQNKLICAICLNFIAADNEMILKCQDTFCRLCLVKAVIGSEDDDVMKCPTRFTKCGTEIDKTDVRIILGEENFHVYSIHKLQSRFDQLFKKDSNDYERM
jgi:hypothetical protein